MSICISAVLIVRDEESRLPSCLDALRVVADEIVIADTGSRDATVSVAQRYTERVVTLNWCDDFAAARNVALGYATGDWVLSLDADEVLLEPECARTRLLEFACTQEPNTLGAIELRSPIGPETDTAVVVDHLSRFFRRGVWRFEGAIHEQLVCISGAGRVAETGVCAWHSGYAQAPDDPHHKAHRNIPLLLRAVQEHPDDEYLLHQLGKAYYSLGQYAEAAGAFDHALRTIRFPIGGQPMGRCGPIARGVLTDLVVTLAYAYVNTGAVELARAHLEHHRALAHPGTQRADFWHGLGYVYLALGDVGRSKEGYERSLGYGPSGEDVLGTGSFSSEYHLGLLSEAEANLAGAVEHYAASLRWKRNFRPTLARAVDWIIEYDRTPAASIVREMDLVAFEAVFGEKLHAFARAGNHVAARKMQKAASAIHLGPASNQGD